MEQLILPKLSIVKQIPHRLRLVRHGKLVALVQLNGLRSND